MIIQSTHVWIEETFLKKQLQIEEGKIVAINNYNEKEVDIDYGDLWILPGFIDIHTHGWCGCDANHPTLQTMEKWQKHLPFEGVTSFLATTSTQSKENNQLAMPILKEAIEKKVEGAEILGINIEGNYISHAFKGAQDAYHIVKPDAKELLEYHRLSGNHIKTVTCAVEFDEDYQFVKEVSNAGIVVSLGHSGASFDEVKEAVQYGAKGITHCGNGMRPFHHRNPGIFGAALNLDELYAEVIGDGVHVHFETAHLIGMMKGKDKLILVTDSAEEKDDPAYASYAKEGAFRLKDGTLFGSALYVNKGVFNLIYQAHLPLAFAINAATINPARYLNVDDIKGSIKVGKDADLVVCDDKVELTAVYCRGKEQIA